MHLCRARGRVWDPGQIISSCTLASNLILALEIYLRSELNSANRNTGIIIVIVVCYNIVFCFVFFLLIIIHVTIVLALQARKKRTKPKKPGKR